ncbi:restriction endonuclease [Aestuariibacter sp. AA17]|uniref:Restriction endonuclease n=1 Tax=Fluctibacter corallii TaxID=2984329 RepID=A0ABT3A6P0_9ALTE|nr:restriction endonuclease [Aestuariibacter sp. AA17]MCV2884350.1 restriction endonuclease [Aestuariibacter sp. AA17]
MELIKIGLSDSELAIRYADLKPSDWGYIYEKYVSQSLAEDGYTVAEHGLEKGFNDGGIDLIAEKGGESIFIQCKYAYSSKFSRQKIEWILYKASSYLAKVYTGEKLNFWLVIPSLNKAFSSRKNKSGKKVYPMAEYFLSHNFTQSKVRLCIKEIDMHR